VTDGEEVLLGARGPSQSRERAESVDDLV